MKDFKKYYSLPATPEEVYFLYGKEALLGRTLNLKKIKR